MILRALYAMKPTTNPFEGVSGGVVARLSRIPDGAPLTEAKIIELDRRLDAYREDRNPGRPWDEVLREIEETRK